MLRNTAASKAAVGPLNTLDNKIVNVLNPQAELVVTNTKIKQLQELLKARDTPTSVSSNELLNTQKLAIVLKALSQRLSGPTKPYIALLQSIKIADPLLLIDGINPIFNNQKLQLQDKLKVNANYFPTPRAQMAYIFGCTSRDTQTHLRPQYTKDLANPFASKEEIINYLSSIYKDPFKVQNAYFSYKSLNIKITETFSAF